MVASRGRSAWAGSRPANAAGACTSSAGGSLSGWSKGWLLPGSGVQFGGSEGQAETQTPPSWQARRRRVSWDKIKGSSNMVATVSGKIKVQADLGEIEKAVRLIVEPSSVVELRALHVQQQYGQPKTVAGFFD